MSVYRCPFCEYNTKNKQHYLKHLNKKKKCFNKNINHFGNNIYNIINKLNKLEKDNIKLKQDNKKLKNENKKLKQTINITNNDNSTNTNTTNNDNRIILNLNINNNGKPFHIKNLNLDDIVKQLSKYNKPIENKIISNIQSRRERIPEKPVEYLEGVIDSLDADYINDKKSKKIFEELKKFMITYDNNFNKFIIDNNKKIFNSYGIEKIKKLKEIDGNEKIYILKENSNKKLEYEETNLKEIYIILQKTLERICNKLINNLDNLNNDNKETSRIANLRMKIKKKFKIIYEELDSEDKTAINKYKFIYNYIFINGEKRIPFTNDYRKIRNILRNTRNELRDTWNETKEIKNKINDKYNSKLYNYIEHIRNIYEGNDLYNEETEIGKLWRDIHRTKNTILLEYYLCNQTIDKKKFTMEYEELEKIEEVKEVKV